MTDEKNPSDKLDQFRVRMPDGMRDLITDLAKKNGRSMNAEIVARLSESIETEKRAQAFMEDDPLKGMLTLAQGMSQSVTAMVSLIMQEGIETGKIKVKEESPK